MSEKDRPSRKPQPSYTAEELLQELFGEQGQPESVSGNMPLDKATLGIYPVADGRLALVHGAQLAEFTPLSSGAKRALHCDLCHYTRSPSEAQIYRVVVEDRRARYVTLCSNIAPCQERAGHTGLERLADHIFPVQSGAELY